MRRLLCLALACCFALAAADCGGPLVRDPLAATALRAAWPGAQASIVATGVCSPTPPAWLVEALPSIDASADANADVQTSEPSAPGPLQSPSQPAAPAAAHVDVVSADAAAAVVADAVAVVVDGGKGAPR